MWCELFFYALFVIACLSYNVVQVYCRKCTHARLLKFDEKCDEKCMLPSSQNTSTNMVSPVLSELEILRRRVKELEKQCQPSTSVDQYFSDADNWDSPKSESYAAIPSSAAAAVAASPSAAAADAAATPAAAPFAAGPSSAAAAVAASPSAAAADAAATPAAARVAAAPPSAAAAVAASPSAAAVVAAAPSSAAAAVAAASLSAASKKRKSKKELDARSCSIVLSNGSKACQAYVYNSTVTKILVDHVVFQSLNGFLARDEMDCYTMLLDFPPISEQSFLTLFLGKSLSGIAIRALMEDWCFTSEYSIVGLGVESDLTDYLCSFKQISVFETHCLIGLPVNIPSVDKMSTDIQLKPILEYQDPRLVAQNPGRATLSTVPCSDFVRLLQGRWVSDNLCNWYSDYLYEAAKSRGILFVRTFFSNKLLACVEGQRDDMEKELDRMTNWRDLKDCSLFDRVVYLTFLDQHFTLVVHDLASKPGKDRAKLIFIDPLERFDDHITESFRHWFKHKNISAYSEALLQGGCQKGNITECGIFAMWNLEVLLEPQFAPNFSFPVNTWKQESKRRTVEDSKSRRKTFACLLRQHCIQFYASDGPIWLPLFPSSRAASLSVSSAAPPAEQGAAAAVVSPAAAPPAHARQKVELEHQQQPKRQKPAPAPSPAPADATAPAEKLSARVHVPAPTPTAYACKCFTKCAGICRDAPVVGMRQRRLREEDPPIFLCVYVLIT